MTRYLGRAAVCMLAACMAAYALVMSLMGSTSSSSSSYNTLTIHPAMTTTTPPPPPSTSPSSPSSLSWQWTKPRRNVLFVKIPKTGGTTLHEVLDRVVAHTPGWHMARPPNNASKVNTCSTIPLGRQAWSAVMRHNSARLDMFASHACYRKSYMSLPRYWSQLRIPLVITVMRHPVSHLVSKYRFAKVCCEDDRAWEWCQPFCNAARAAASASKDNDDDVYSLKRYLDYACGNGNCNEQKRYMGEGFSKEIIDSYFQVLILERFDESLALLGVKMGLPVRALAYLKENSNTKVPMPQLSAEDKARLVNEQLEFDAALYRIAKTRLNRTLDELTSEERQEYQSTLTTLRDANARAEAECQPRCEQELELSIARKQCLDECLRQVTGEIWGPDDDGVPPVPSPSSPSKRKKQG